VKNIFVIACAIGLFFIHSFGVRAAHAYDDNDSQVWTGASEEVEISNKSKIALDEEFRWGDDAREFYYHHYDAGLSYSVKDYLKIAGGYRHVYELKNGKFKQENQPFMAATLLWDMRGFKFEDRNRLEYRHFEYRSDSWRYHNKVTMKFPAKFTRLEIQPYLSDEIYLSFGEKHMFDQNRFSVGLNIKLTKNIHAELYAMRASSRGSDTNDTGVFANLLSSGPLFDDWINSNVFGTKLKVSF
jgi:hypothetical protein